LRVKITNPKGERDFKFDTFVRDGEIEEQIATSRLLSVRPFHLHSVE
jgi:hypothetical protein